MSNRNGYDTIIAGGGVAGAATAALLAARGQRVALVDRRRPRPLAVGSELDPRVVAISPGAQRVLDAAGGWPLLSEERIGPYDRMQVHAQTGRIEFRASEHGLERLGWIVEIPALQEALWRALESGTGVNLISPDSVTGFEQRENSIRVDLESGSTLRAAVLVAADGSRSRLRELAGIPCRQWHYNQHALVTHIETEKANPGLAWQRFTEHGPLALLPLADGRSSIVWSLPSGHAGQLRSSEDSDFLAELNCAQDSPFGSATGATRRHTLPLVRRQANRLVHQRLALVGDAARSIHPLAGQGLNLGLMDAAALSELLGKGSSGLSVTDRLVRYERWRLSAGSLIAGGIHAINELTAGTPVGRHAAGLGLSLTQGAWPLRELFVQRACGMDSDSPELARIAR